MQSKGKAQLSLFISGWFWFWCYVVHSTEQGVLGTGLQFAFLFFVASYVHVLLHSRWLASLSTTHLCYFLDFLIFELLLFSFSHEVSREFYYVHLVRPPRSYPTYSLESALLLLRQPPALSRRALVPSVPPLHYVVRYRLCIVCSDSCLRRPCAPFLTLLMGGSCMSYRLHVDSSTAVAHTPLPGTWCDWYRVPHPVTKAACPSVDCRRHTIDHSTD